MPSPDQQNIDFGSQASKLDKMTFQISIIGNRNIFDVLIPTSQQSQGDQLTENWSEVEERKREKQLYN